jgi:hypothetical protein
MKLDQDTVCDQDSKENSHRGNQPVDSVMVAVLGVDMVEEAGEFNSQLPMGNRALESLSEGSM